MNFLAIYSELPNLRQQKKKESCLIVILALVTRKFMEQGYQRVEILLQSIFATNELF